MAKPCALNLEDQTNWILFQTIDFWEITDCICFRANLIWTFSLIVGLVGWVPFIWFRWLMFSKYTLNSWEKFTEFFSSFPKHSTPKCKWCFCKPPDPPQTNIPPPFPSHTLPIPLSSYHPSLHDVFGRLQHHQRRWQQNEDNNNDREHYHGHDTIQDLSESSNVWFQGSFELLRWFSTRVRWDMPQNLKISISTRLYCI